MATEVVDRHVALIDDDPMVHAVTVTWRFTLLTRAPFIRKAVADCGLKAKHIVRGAESKVVDCPACLATREPNRWVEESERQITDEQSAVKEAERILRETGQAVPA